jgi:hypothetical protein
MLANFAIGISSVLTCLADDIGHKGSLPTGVPWVGRLRLMQGVAPINPRGHIDKNLVASTRQPISRAGKRLPLKGLDGGAEGI